MDRSNQGLELGDFLMSKAEYRIRNEIGRIFWIPASGHTWLVGTGLAPGQQVPQPEVLPLPPLHPSPSGSIILRFAIKM